jgi:hypothetical protein
MRTGAEALGGIAGGVADFVGGLFWGLAGGDAKPPPTKEQQQAATEEREARTLTLEERIRRYNEEHKQRQEQEQDRGRSHDLSRK